MARIPGTTIYTSTDLVAIRNDSDAKNSPTFFSDNYVVANKTTDKEQVAIDTTSSERVAAPFVQPAAKGRPIYRGQRGTKRRLYTPGYIKMQDSLLALDTLVKLPQELAYASLNTGQPTMTQMQRCNTIVEDMINTHIDATQVRRDLMVSQIIRTGKCVIDYAPESGEETDQGLLDFDRDPNLTEVLASGDQWGDSSRDIFDHIERIMDKMVLAKFGGKPNVMLMGTSAKNAFMNSVRNGSMKDFLDTRYAGVSNIDLTRGAVNTPTQLYPTTFLGKINDLNIYHYWGWYTDPDTGAQLPLIQPNEIILTAPNLQCEFYHATIQDIEANLNPMPIFTKSWLEHDPSSRAVLTQSAPLPIVINPNASFRAVVTA